MFLPYAMSKIYFEKRRGLVPSIPLCLSKADGMFPSLQGYYHPTSPHTGVQWGSLVHVFLTMRETISVCVVLHIIVLLACETFLDSSLLNRSLKPVNKLPPPVNTTFPSRT